MILKDTGWMDEWPTLGLLASPKQGQVFQTEMLCLHSLMTIQTQSDSQSRENKWQLRKQWVLILSELSVLLVEFSIQLARVNSIQAKVQLIQLLCGKYLQAHGPSCQS